MGHFDADMPSICYSYDFLLSSKAESHIYPRKCLINSVGSDLRIYSQVFWFEGYQGYDRF